MHTPILPVQTSTAAPAAQTKAGSGAPDGDFQRTLARQLEQRQAEQRHSAGQAAPKTPRPPARAQAPAAAPARPAPASTPARRAEAAPADAPKTAKTAETAQSADTDTDADAAKESTQEGSVADSVAAAAPAQSAATPDETATANTPPADPVANMLALVASFNPAPAPVLAPAGSGRAAAPAGTEADAGIAPASGVRKAAPGLNATALQAAAQAGTDKPAPPQVEPAPDGAAETADRGAPALPAPAMGKALAEPALALAGKAREALPETLNAIKEAPAPAPAALAPAAAPEVVQAASALPGDKLNGRVGSPAWDRELGQKVVWMVAGGDQSASLTLNPPDLGPLQVVLNVSNDKTDAAFTSNQPEVRQALEAALPRLREMMSEAGIALGNATVSAGMGNQGGESGGQARGGRGGGTGHAGEAAPAAAPLRRASVPGQVDTFA